MSHEGPEPWPVEEPKDDPLVPTEPEEEEEEEEEPEEDE
jgi:hypothetical protein